MKIYVKDLIRECNAKLIYGDENLELKNFNKDTRTIEKNDIYLGIRGEKLDGNKFIDEAFEKGAIACIIDNLDYEKTYENKTLIYVENTVEALQKIAKYKRSLYNIPVIAITGSVGKTSTKDIIASVLEKKYKVLKTPGNYNNAIGLPLSILKLEDHECLVLEMGMNNFKEISLLTKIARPTTAVITNIGTAHIGNLGSRENILKAKLEILEGLEKTGALIINNDNDLLHNALNSLKCNTITIGINNKSNYNAVNIKEDYSEFYINDLKITTPVPTEAYIYNSLIAYAVGKRYGVEDDKIVLGINYLNRSKSRLERHEINKITIIDDTYNASFDSIKDSLKYLNVQKHKRKIAVLGDVLETGKFLEEIHRSIGKFIKTLNLDLVLTVGKASNFINEELINEKNIKIKHFENNEDLTKYLLENLIKEDIVLLKASSVMNLYSVVKELLERL